MNMMDTDNTPLSEQAAHWWVVLHDENASPTARQDFAEWIAKSPERVQAYLKVTMLHRALRAEVVRWPRASAQDLIAAAREKSNVAELTAANTSTQARKGAHPRRMLLAASVLLACIGVTSAVWYQVYGTPTYATALGEQRSVLLNDGTLVTLNTATKIEVSLTKERRVVRLDEGEALFQVAHDESRPFDVMVGGTTIRAVGTQFNVDRRARQTTVTVIEGKVLVDEVPVAAVERVVVAQEKVGQPERIKSIAPVTAWTQRRLVFDRRPLGQVAEEFNRYNRQKIVIDDANLESQEVTGVFQANDPDSFLTFLSDVPGVEITVRDEGSRIVTVSTEQRGGGGPN